MEKFELGCHNDVNFSFEVNNDLNRAFPEELVFVFLGVVLSLSIGE